MGTSRNSYRGRFGYRKRLQLRGERDRELRGKFGPGVVNELLRILKSFVIFTTFA